MDSMPSIPVISESKAHEAPTASKEKMAPLNVLMVCPSFIDQVMQADRSRLVLENIPPVLSAAACQDLTRKSESLACHYLTCGEEGRWES
jgi:hypothetical protein